ncbi:MAG: permease-like cell division protein FtsX [Bacteroidetes bacterium]|nr:permease-like cell division protein FtsX [Bacteroidota bacterium]MDA1119740.1 permease-like cell division protein FtsX [Bacteroidota bacterium]
MTASEKRFKKKKLGNYPFLSVIFSISISLFVIGLFGLLLIYGNGLTNLIRENIEIQVFLNKQITENERIKISKTLSSKEYVLLKEDKPQITLVTKEDAAAEFIQETGEEFIEFIGENPLRDALIIRIKPEYHTTERMAEIKKEIESERGVYEVAYVENLVESINSNLAKVGGLLAGFAALLVVIVIILINNTIKLALFSQRFLIRSMQLVGATAYFIKKPFLLRAINYGFLSGVIASMLLFALMRYTSNRIEDLALLQDSQQLLFLMGLLLLLGVLIGFASTYRAINKYLKMSLDDLY